MSAETGDAGPDRRRRVYLILAFEVGLVALHPALAWQGSSTPTAVTLTAANCHTEARSFAELHALFATPEVPAPRPTPGVLPRGVPADAATIAAITATVQELVACWNAGSLPRAYGLYTDDYLRRLLARQGPPDRAAYDFFATPNASADTDQTVIVAIAAVRILPNGQAGAIVVLRYPNLPSDKTFFFVFVPAGDGDSWRIADILGEISFSVP